MIVVSDTSPISALLTVGAEQILIQLDERKGRMLAMQEGVPVIGLLGVVLLARRKGLIPSARDLLHRLADEAGAYLATDLVESALKTVGE